MKAGLPLNLKSQGIVYTSYDEYNYYCYIYCTWFIKFFCMELFIINYWFKFSISFYWRVFERYSSVCSFSSIQLSFALA